jgi:hypothetical protein
MIRISEIFELPTSRLFTNEFADLLPLMSDPDYYRNVERSFTVPCTASRVSDVEQGSEASERASGLLVSREFPSVAKAPDTLEAPDLACLVGGDGTEHPC